MSILDEFYKIFGIIFFLKRHSSVLAIQKDYHNHINMSILDEFYKIFGIIFFLKRHSSVLAIQKDYHNVP